jgi:hypothetical protein
MPRSLAGNINYFARHSLDDRVSLIGIDYQHRTMNLYLSEMADQMLLPNSANGLV